MPLLRPRSEAAVGPPAPSRSCAAPPPPTRPAPRHARPRQMHSGSLDLEDLGWQRRAYRPWPAYSASKLASILHAKARGALRLDPLQPLRGSQGSPPLAPLPRAPCPLPPAPCPLRPTARARPPASAGAGAPAGGRRGARAAGHRLRAAPGHDPDRADPPHAGHRPGPAAGVPAMEQERGAGRGHQRVGGGGAGAGGPQRRLPRRLPGRRRQPAAERSGVGAAGVLLRCACPSRRCVFDEP